MAVLQKKKDLSAREQPAERSTEEGNGMIRFERSAANRNDWKGKIGEAHGHLASPGGATEDAEPIPLAAWATSPKPNYLRLGLASLVHRGRTLSCCALADGNPQPNSFFFFFGEPRHSPVVGMG
jgi:hypothetical protein